MTEQSELQSRAAVYRLLSRLWRSEVDETLLLDLTSGDMRDAFVQAGGQLPNDTSAATIDELAFDYCQLFLGPSSHLPPYQSVWTEGQFQGAAIASMTQYIDLLNTDQWADETMLDHLWIELDVMANLLDQRASATDSPEALALSTEITATFFRDHLSWPIQLCTIAAERAQTDFYRSMVEVTSEFLASEQVTLGLTKSTA